MAAIPAAFSHRGRAPLTHKFVCKTSDTFLKYQLVCPDGTDGTGVTATTSSDVETAIGISTEAITTAAAGRELEVMLLAAGDIFIMINGGTCTFGASVAITSTAGKVVDVGATPASGSCIGVMVGATTSTTGDYVPILIGRH